MLGLIGKKIGMTAIFDGEGKRIPVTVIQAGPCPICQIKTAENDGYFSLQLAFEPAKKRVTKPLLGHFKRANIPPHKHLFEFRVSPQEIKGKKVGEVLTLEIFSEGEKIDCTGISKGKGFKSAIFRHHFGGGPKTHGQSDRERAPGSIGASSFPSRVFRGQRMAGHMGNVRVTVKNLTIAKVIPEKSLVLVNGAVPGPRGAIVILKKRNVYAGPS